MSFGINEVTVCVLYPYEKQHILTEEFFLHDRWLNQKLIWQSKSFIFLPINLMIKQLIIISPNDICNKAMVFHYLISTSVTSDGD